MNSKPAQIRQIDPHDDSFIAKNLREEEWVEYQRDNEVEEYVVAIKAAFDNGMVARINRLSLSNLGFDVACKAGTPAPLILCTDNGHWAALALCMLTHGRFQLYPDEECYRFTRSPFEQEPMYYNNIEWVNQKGFHFLVPVRKESETKVAGSPRNGEDDTSHGVSGKRSRDGDSPRQTSLFDIH